MRYDAFISYRHTELDLYVAKKLHKGLETFRVPRAVAKKSGKKNIKRVFRDQEELPIGSDLGDNIEGALAESEFLLVICSPRTPESYWVQKEIATFIQMHDREHVLAILVEGEPDEAFPKQLLVDENGNPVEPLAADVRGASKSEIDKKLKSEILRLAAPLLYCSYDDLRQRHRERRMKKLAVSMGAVAALAVAFGGYNAYNAALIEQNLEGKQRNQSKYLADTSLRLLEEGDRRAAVLVALEALPFEDNERPYVAEAQYALGRALHCYDTGNVIRMDRALHHDLPVQKFWINDEGSRVVSIDQGGYVYVWNAEDGQKLAQIAPRVNERGYTIKPINAILYQDTIVICDEESVYAVSYDGQQVWQQEVDCIYCEFEPQEGIAACVANDKVTFWNIADGNAFGEMPNQTDASYSAEMAFDMERNQFVVSHFMDEDEPQGCVSIYNFMAQTISDIYTTPTYIADLAFASDGNVVVAGDMYADILDSSSNVAIGYVEKLAVDTQDVLWQQEYEYQKVGIDAAGTQLKCRSYEDDETGDLHDEVLLSVDNTAYTWDAQTGEQIAEIGTGSAIMKFLVSVNGSFGYLAESSGAIDIVDMTTGTNYSSATIETGKVLRDIQIKNGVLAMRAYASPDITLMKYQEGTGMECLEEYSTSINRIFYSKEESYYAVSMYSQEYRNEVYFYRTSDNTLVGEWKDSDAGYVVADCFVNDTCYAAVCSDGSILFYDVASEKQSVQKLPEGMRAVECDMNAANTLAFLWEGSEYCVVDLKQQKIVAGGTLDYYIRGGIISEDGTSGYCNVDEIGVCKVNIKTGEVSAIELGEHFVLSNCDAQDALAVSADGSMLAVSCDDNMLRVLETKRMQVVAEIPFAVQYRSFLEFSADNTEIMMQGDDYYFRVYSLEKEKFTYISTDQYYEIEQAVRDEVSATISLITSTDMVVVDGQNYERVAYVEDGKAYLPKHARVLCNYTRTLYQFPYMTLDMLYDEAERQFGGDMLTELERIQYHVE